MTETEDTKQLNFLLPDSDATVAFGKCLAPALKQGAVIYLYGDLGAGKTTFSRGVVQGLGHNGNVKSPTYTLVESYQFSEQSVFHFDLYRLADPEELEFMGVRDYFADNNVSLIEWPQRGEGFLPEADLTVSLAYEGEARQLTMTAKNVRGIAILAALKSSTAFSSVTENE
ncbi:tRNA (adenosine(37)-N6)-threonylcarbamoyltransferase complex ATPase subunit type 1 TsaE [Corallincola luteus]|uniref:tRNA threonylcarbamoyladenosine biosynthesis protein TsaE n=1 Tax=Corallincola luteus TaxID=1775177 RepID=A0ABY2ARH3_9GAMM|nr:tRNA (adenosine(37)-N6)-threonylcarbamoyltransferase complex ATPase subunit type 1 TsaE [Corallincola luteus]TCI04662.1 tRNA (adenosine(37)-N6)-threonylcarbamoyltransferase complex ATPase subunit type 1 TsaE [Corallincola luteus]